MYLASVEAVEQDLGTSSVASLLSVGYSVLAQERGPPSWAACSCHGGLPLVEHNLPVSEVKMV